VIIDNQPELESNRGVEELEIFYDSEIQIYENHNHFFYFIICILSLKLFRSNIIDYHQFSISVYPFNSQIETENHRITTQIVSIVQNI